MASDGLAQDDHLMYFKWRYYGSMGCDIISCYELNVEVYAFDCVSDD